MPHSVAQPPSDVAYAESPPNPPGIHYHLPVLTRFKAYVVKHGLLRAGDRIAIAVSGGADSVALLRIMLELRAELGVVLSVAHFNHKIRGLDSDADQQFVSDLAAAHDLEFHLGSGDTPARSARHQQSLETAARDLRYAFFRELLASNQVGKIATAHTMDDQAETVLMRLIRGAGTRGLAGIYPALSHSAIIRPLLGFRRLELRSYLQAQNQTWREDSTNSNLHHTRNSVRHELLPLLSQKFNPAIVQTLARTAEVARLEEEYWSTECKRLLPLLVLPGKPVRGGGRTTSSEKDSGFGLSLELLKKQPEAMQRRLIRAAAFSANIVMDMHHVADIADMLITAHTSCELPGDWRVSKGPRELRFERIPNLPRSPGGTFRAKLSTKQAIGYDYPLPVPGQVRIPEISSVVHTRLLPLTEQDGRYNHSLSHGETPGHHGALVILDSQLHLRNWRPGDRFWPAHTGCEKKVKELLQSLKVEQPGRKLWPVVTAGEQVIWVRGARPRPICLERDGVKHSLLIELECSEINHAG